MDRNLVNANHVIFVAPLLAETQYEHDAAIAQAVARSRRYGQEKTVYIYHVVALRTIDVDILEYRYKRTDAMTTADSEPCAPATLQKKKKTKLVRSKDGDLALVPVSWLADEEKRSALGIGEKIESFASLISFSEKFQQDDDK